VRQHGRAYKKEHRAQCHPWLQASTGDPGNVSSKSKQNTTTFKNICNVQNKMNEYK
jgi:hypothetical protein